MPAELKNWNNPWPDLANMRVAGSLWRPSDSHAGPTGGWFSGELAIEGTRFVLKSVQVMLGDVPLELRSQSAPRAPRPSQI